MPKRSYTPTETDRLTGERLRTLRKRRGETLAETTERSGFGRDRSTLAATERGERQLTEIEAARLAAHFGVAVSQIITHPKRPALLPVARGGWTPVTEQDWLGNEDPKPSLFAVPSKAGEEAERAHPITLPGTNPNLLMIDLKQPLTPEQYRAQVWVPYLEARYATEQKAG